MNLNIFMQNGIGHIMKRAGRYYLRNRKGVSFLAHTLPRLKQSARLRSDSETAGTHIPPFLIASIASRCNLYCQGCYARAGGSCGSAVQKTDMSAEKWGQIFTEASDLGVSFILLAGGEPLTRPDVIKQAAAQSNIIYPIFTNGTMIDDQYLALFDESRNLIPVLSIEGSAAETDGRRGSGVYASIEKAMSRMQEKQLLFGTSITVTSENFDTVLRVEFMDSLRQKGCGLVFFIEYVPIQKGTEYLALDPSAQERLKERTDELKQQFDDTVILAFPGDEKKMGGCLASGRGFFHINPSGGAEPCPFSPYAQHNLKNTSIKEVLSSQYFRSLQQIAAEAGPHTGGCTLFEHQKAVQALQ